MIRLTSEVYSTSPFRQKQSSPAKLREERLQKKLSHKFRNSRSCGSKMVSSELPAVVLVVVARLHRKETQRVTKSAGGKPFSAFGIQVEHIIFLIRRSFGTLSRVRPGQDTSQNFKRVKEKTEKTKSLSGPWTIPPVFDNSHVFLYDGEH